MIRQVTTSKRRSFVNDSCPKCGRPLMTVPYHCSCGWHLMRLATWQKCTPFEQGFVIYMQGSWPTSELRGQKNPYPKDSEEWTEFNRGEQRGVQAAQDSEE
jgi:hypothetical protein